MLASLEIPLSLFISAFFSFLCLYFLRSSSSHLHSLKLSLLSLSVSLVLLCTFLLTTLFAAAAVTSIPIAFWSFRAFTFWKMNNDEETVVGTSSGLGGYKPVFAGAISSFV